MQFNDADDQFRIGIGLAIAGAFGAPVMPWWIALPFLLYGGWLIYDATHGDWKKKFLPKRAPSAYGWKLRVPWERIAPDAERVGLRRAALLHITYDYSRKETSITGSDNIAHLETLDEGIFEVEFSEPVADPSSLIIRRAGSSELVEVIAKDRRRVRFQAPDYKDKLDIVFECADHH
jgi:hypothetical protein